MSENNEAISPVSPVLEKRSWLAILSGLFLIAICVFLFSTFVVSYFEPPSFALLISPAGLFFLWIAHKQYRSLFCCQPFKTRALSGCFFVLGFFGVFAAVSSVIELANASESDWDFLPLFLGLFFGGVFFALLGFVNAKDFQNRRKNATETPVRYPFHWKRELLGLLLIFLSIAATSYWIIQSLPPIEGRHLSYQEFQYKSFPSEGTDYSYMRRARGTLYCEFTIDEKGFRDWIASEKRWEYCEPIDDSVEVPRFMREKNDPEGDIIATEGLKAGYGESKGGRAVYDSQTNRAYYWTYY